MAYYYSIPIEEMEDELESYRFSPVDLMYRNRPVKEWVYERKLPNSPNHYVRVYTGINRYGQTAGESRGVGKDAIRIQVIYRDEKGETLVSQTKRVHRVGGWRKNLKKRMLEVSSQLPQVEFDRRGEPMTLRKKGKSKFWGSRDYPKYKETKPFSAEYPDWDDIDWETDEPPNKEGWEDEIDWDAEEITLKEFDDTTEDAFSKDMGDKITLMLRKKSKMNKYGDIGCPSCGSIGLFSSEIIAKGKKWYCYECLYEDKTESIKSRGDITLEKFGLVITCPICNNGIKAYNNDSMLKHIKKCGE